MSELYIDKKEVLRYLGYRNQVLGENMEALIDECIEEIKSIARGRHVYKFFNITRESGKMILENSSIQLIGNDIYKHLENSKTCILMAATLGNAVDMRIRYYEKTNMTKAMILDACASTAIEDVCDSLCRELEETVGLESNILTDRYSPGYGDLTLEIQKNFIAAIGADKAIGLTASSSNLLIPGKSVTAVIGVVDKKHRIQGKNCSVCSKFSSCQFRRENRSCGS